MVEKGPSSCRSRTSSLCLWWVDMKAHLPTDMRSLFPPPTVSFYRPAFGCQPRSCHVRVPGMDVLRGAPPPPPPGVVVRVGGPARPPMGKHAYGAGHGRVHTQVEQRQPCWFSLGERLGYLSSRARHPLTTFSQL